MGGGKHCGDDLLSNDNHYANYCLHVEERGVGITADLPGPRRHWAAEPGQVYTILSGNISGATAGDSYNVVVSSAIQALRC